MKFKRFATDEELFLDSCPFCGTEPEIKHIGNNHTKQRKIEIGCRECGVRLVKAALRNDFSWLEDIIVKRWNSRIK